MSQLEAKRRERAAAGSRRKRDLEAAAPSIDFAAWVREHLPDEHPDCAQVAAELEYLKWPPRERRMPAAQEVVARLRLTGRDRESLGAVA